MASFDMNNAIWLPLFLPIFLLDLLLSVVMKFLSPKEDVSSEMQSVEVGKATETHGAPRRSPKAKTGELFSVHRGATTVYEMVEDAVEKYGDRVAMQNFEFLGLRKLKETDRFPSKQFSDELVQVTYKELGQKIHAFGKGLRQIGMEPQPQTDDFDSAKGKFTLVIFEDTCKEWSTALQGAMSQRYVGLT